MPQSADGIYARRAWNDPPPRWSYTGPFASQQERLTQQALNPMFMTSDEIANYVGNPLPQVAVFRARQGYLPYQSRQAGIADIITQTRFQPNERAEWFSGGPAGIESGPRYMSNSLGGV